MRMENSMTTYLGDGNGAPDRKGRRVFFILAVNFFGFLYVRLGRLDVPDAEQYADVFVAKIARQCDLIRARHVLDLPNSLLPERG